MSRRGESVERYKYFLSCARRSLNTFEQSRVTQSMPEISITMMVSSPGRSPAVAAVLNTLPLNLLITETFVNSVRRTLRITAVALGIDTDRCILPLK
jgi:hypothetical protein